MLRKGQRIVVPANHRLNATADTHLLVTDCPQVYDRQEWVRISGCEISSDGAVQDWPITIIVRARFVRQIAADQAADPNMFTISIPTELRREFGRWALHRGYAVTGDTLTPRPVAPIDTNGPAYPINNGRWGSLRADGIP